MPTLRFKTCRLLSGNVWKRELTIIQRRILQRLRTQKISIKINLFSQKNLNSYIQSQTTRKLSLFHGNLPITEMHRRIKRSYIPFLLLLLIMLILLNVSIWLGNFYFFSQVVLKGGVLILTRSGLGAAGTMIALAILSNDINEGINMLPGSSREVIEIPSLPSSPAGGPNLELTLGQPEPGVPIRENTEPTLPHLPLYDSNNINIAAKKLFHTLHREGQNTVSQDCVYIMISDKIKIIKMVALSNPDSFWSDHAQYLLENGIKTQAGREFFPEKLAFYTNQALSHPENDYPIMEGLIKLRDAYKNMK